MAYSENEKLWWVDHIRAITFIEARNAGATFTSQSLIAKKIKRSEDFVKQKCGKNPFECEMQMEDIGIGGMVLSQGSKDFISSSTGRQKKKCA
jgi:hypothetical protein